jgi:hypothetical protein
MIIIHGDVMQIDVEESLMYVQVVLAYQKVGGMVVVVKLVHLIIVVVIGIGQKLDVIENVMILVHVGVVPKQIGVIVKQQ